MVASFLTQLTEWQFYTQHPVAALIGLFQLWMGVDAIRRREWLWALFIFAGFGISALWYYFAVYREAPSATRGFELPGAHHRKRIRELQAKIHHLDKAHHHLQLADIYFQQGRLEKAAASYRASLEREPQDIDARAHFGQCLLRQGQAAAARPWLEGVCAENPQHEYGHSLMGLAETLTVLGEQEAALALWQQVTARHAYPRAKVQLAELYVTRGEPEPARAELRDVIADEAHAPAYQRRRDRVWVRRGRALLRRLPAERA